MIEHSPPLQILFLQPASTLGLQMHVPLTVCLSKCVATSNKRHCFLVIHALQISRIGVGIGDRAATLGVGSINCYPLLPDLLCQWKPAQG